MDTDDKSRLWGALACYVIFALVWFVVLNKHVLEHVHAYGIAEGVTLQFKVQMKWFVATIIKFGFTAGIIWGAISGYNYLKK